MIADRLAVLADYPRQVVIHPVNRRPGPFPQPVVPACEHLFQLADVDVPVRLGDDLLAFQTVAPAVIKRKHHVEGSGFLVGVIQRHLRTRAAPDFADRQTVPARQDRLLEFPQVIEQRRQIGELRPVRSQPLRVHRQFAVLKFRIAG